MSDPRDSLKDLRREIDRIDDAIHDLVMRRAEMADRIRTVKGDGPAFRPAREAELLRRLMQRHKGALPGAAVARIWREMVAATLGLQHRLTVAVADGGEHPGVWDLARDHFGSHSAMIEPAAPAQVVRAVADGEALVGVLPLPRDGEAEPWWPTMAAIGRDKGQPRVVARLPFVAAGNARGERPGALAIARMEPEPTGRDCSLLVVETQGELSRARLVEILTRAKLQPITIVGAALPGSDDARLALVEVDGFIAAVHEAIAALTAEAPDAIVRVTPIGAYAVPFNAA